jgi:hypothetical protein
LVEIITVYPWFIQKININTKIHNFSGNTFNPLKKQKRKKFC